MSYQPSYSPHPRYDQQQPLSPRHQQTDSYPPTASGYGRSAEERAHSQRTVGDAIHHRPHKEEQQHDHPDDEEALLDEDKGSLIEWKTVLNWRTYARVKYIPYYIGLIIIGVLVCLMTLYHKQILAWLRPVADYLKDLTCGWLIPIAILIVISFPPLFGHEIVGILCGLVWGLWIGFGIVAAGTFFGEMANFVVFKYWCSARAEKLEKKDLSYACLSHVIREGGFWIALLARLSAIPGHFTTVVFSCCGMSIWTFALSCLCSLPKQLIVVYLGVAIENTNADKKTKIIQNVVLAISFLVTVLAAWWIWRKMNQARGPVVRERRRLAMVKRQNSTSAPALSSKYPASGAFDSSASVDNLVSHDNGRPTHRPHHSDNWSANYPITHGRDEHVGSWYQVPPAGAMTAEERELEQHLEDLRRTKQGGGGGGHEERMSSDPYRNPLQIYDPYGGGVPPTSSSTVGDEPGYHASSYGQPPSQPPSGPSTPRQGDRQTENPYPPQSPSPPRQEQYRQQQHHTQNPYPPPNQQNHQQQQPPYPPISNSGGGGYALDDRAFASPATPTGGRRPFDPPAPASEVGAPAYSFVDGPERRGGGGGAGGGGKGVSLRDGQGGGDDWRR